MRALLLCLALLVALAAAIPIEDCCCDATTVDIANDETLHDKLETLRQTTFFKIFRVNLMSDCPFWREDGMCTRRSCSVWECEDHEVPVVFKKELEADAAFSSSSTFHPHSDEADNELPISRVDFSVSSDLVKWTENDENTWIIQHPGDKLSFVDLTRNLESYTGFEGVDAHKMWRAIYKENCFHGGTDNMCFEERVFFRLISGLHSSISAHTADKFPVNQLKRRVTVVGNTEFEEFYVEPVGEMPAVDGASIQVFNQKLGYFPDRINNLYFVFVFLLRAVNKASEILRYYDYNTGNATEDQLTRRLVLTLLDSTMVKDCDTSHSFDESSMFNSPDKLPLLKQFRNKFRNISQIIDCVGCEKCRLHGKLQVLGIGTALKILFAGKSGLKLKPGELELNRNEVLALINTVGKFSHSIQIVHSMRKIEFKHKVVYYGMIAAFCAGLLLIGVTALRWMGRRGKAKAKSS